MSSRIYTAPPRIQLLSEQYSNSDTLSANSGTQTFATSYTLPANLLQAGIAVRVSFGLQIVSSASTVPSVGFIVQIGGVSVYTMTATVATASLASRGFGLQFLVAGTASPGASVAVSTETFGVQPWVGAFAGIANGMNLTAQPVNLATNGTLAITLQVSTSNSTGGNSYGLRQMIVEQIGP